MCIARFHAVDKARATVVLRRAFWHSVVVYALALSTSAFGQNTSCVVDAPQVNLNVRAYPLGDVLGVIQSGLEVSIVSNEVRKDDSYWVQIRPLDQSWIGWVNRKFLTCWALSTPEDEGEVPDDKRLALVRKGFGLGSILDMGLLNCHAADSSFVSCYAQDVNLAAADSFANLIGKFTEYCEDPERGWCTPNEGGVAVAVQESGINGDAFAASQGMSNFSSSFSMREQSSEIIVNCFAYIATFDVVPPLDVREDDFRLNRGFNLQFEDRAVNLTFTCD